MTTANDHARSAPSARAHHYDSFAEAYSAENETSLLNAYYERPAMLSLAGDVAGRRILDAGCGSGPLFAALRERGARVTGVDASGEMVRLARRRLGDDADLHVADLADPLPFPDGAFDDVLCSLVLHYLRDWVPTLTEMRRVLRPGGRVIASIQHPFVEYATQDPRPDYHATTSYTQQWTHLPGHAPTMTFWRRPLHAMTDAFTAAGFRLTAFSEPQPDPAARELYPEDYEDLATKMCFLLFALEAAPAPASAASPE